MREFWNLNRKGPAWLSEEKEKERDELKWYLDLGKIRCEESDRSDMVGLGSWIGGEGKGGSGGGRRWRGRRETKFQVEVGEGLHIGMREMKMKQKLNM